ncbi:hypothetical protein B0H17DRAFT_1200007 [Mycena rosella]|uniref:Uncharacterized protein n=1 Tax=Mycena rosella TaxID=1033263 RepID=A0AAD7DK82_MYCRO|nr:hypothetical protein B0H17DRAFT_1200007 [Mycena rosella]
MPSMQARQPEDARLQLSPQVEPRYQLLESALAQEAAELASGAAQPRPLNDRGVQRRAAWEMAGSCDARDVPLAESDLYVGPERPGEQDTTRAHQRCTICLQVKSHPVSAGIAIAMPASGSGLSALGPARSAQCMKVIHMPPVRHYGEEDGIAGDFPSWEDKSVVTFSWSGLTFPRRNSDLPLSQ